MSYRTHTSQLIEEDTRERLAHPVICGVLEYVTKNLVVEGSEVSYNGTEECDEIGLLICSEWPKYVHSKGHFIIGPNGTTISSAAFASVNWTTTAKATRSLLSLIFNTENLTKFTPGGGRFSKKRLDPLKIDDIVHCVLVEVKGSSVEDAREVIAAVCAEASKRYIQNRKAKRYA